MFIVLMLYTLMCIAPFVVIMVFMVKKTKSSYQNYKKQNACPKCQKPFSFTEIGRKVIQEEKISKMEDLPIKDKKHNIIGYQQTRIYGAQKTYKITYQCKECNYVFTNTKTEDVY